MACGCKKGLGDTIDKPMVFGKPSGSPFLVVATITLAGQSPGVPFYADGDGLQSLIDNGWVEVAS